MNILVVDGYEETAEGREKAAAMVSLSLNERKSSCITAYCIRRALSIQ